MDSRHRSIIYNNLEKLVKQTINFEALLNTLIDKKMFTELMVEKIKKGNSDKEQKERMYRMIPKRGPHAFNILYCALKAVEHAELALCLQSNEMTRDIIDYNSNQQPRGETIRDTETDKMVYKMNSIPKGHMLLINVDNGDRKGSQIDFDKMKDLWANKLGYEVLTPMNSCIKREEFKRMVENFRDLEKHKLADSAVVFIMSHGKENVEKPLVIDIKLSDGDIPSEWVLEQFTISKCPNLINKPKLFFFVMCRGDLKNFATNKYSCERIEFDTYTNLMPEKSDMLIVYSTIPGHVSERDIERGTLFVQHLNEVFFNQAHNDDIKTMLDKVSQNMRPRCTLNLQVFAFDKLLYFNIPQ